MTRSPKALREAVKPSGGPSNGGFDLNMWASIVDVDGTVCAVAFTEKPLPTSGSEAG